MARRHYPDVSQWRVSVAFEAILLFRDELLGMTQDAWIQVSVAFEAILLFREIEFLGEGGAYNGFSRLRGDSFI